MVSALGRSVADPTADHSDFLTAQASKASDLDVR